MFQRAPDHIISEKIDGFHCFEHTESECAQQLLWRAPQWWIQGAFVEGLVLQETCRKKFYELEPQLGICFRRGDVLPIHPKMRVPAGVQWTGDSETKCS